MTQSSTNQRLYSLDALRGFDMFWIMGAEEIVHQMAKATGSPIWEAAANQLTHPSWNGFHLYDLIFPLFLFLAGVATPYSVGRELEKGEAKSKLFWRVVRRGLTLVLLGIIYNNGLEFRPLADVRFPSVLGRIGLAYMFANIIYLYTKERMQMIWVAGILLGYWALLAFTSAPGFPMGDLTMEGNFASYIDRSILPGRFHVGIHDPEGLVSTIPAIATALLGILAGNLLKKSPLTQIQKVLRLAGIGAGFLVLAQLWNLVFPINKNLWTSSFVAETAGCSFLLLSLFYYIIDVKGYKKWAFFFVVIGMNSILIYLSSVFIDWEFTTQACFKWLVQLVSDPYKLVIGTICYTLVKWAFLYFMYLKKAFLRV